MTIDTATLTGTIYDPAGGSVAGGAVTFLLSSWDVDATSGETVVPKVKTAVIQSDATIDIDLWPNARGEKGGTYYTVTALIDTSTGQKAVDLGRIQLADVATTDLSDELDSPPAGETYWKKLSKEDYDNAIAELEVLTAEAQGYADTAQIYAQELRNSVMIPISEDEQSVLVSIGSLYFVGEADTPYHHVTLEIV